MNKQIFLDGLRAALASLPAAEIEKTLAYYDEILNDRIEDGMTEEEAVKTMEPIEVLAARAKEAPVKKAVAKVKKSGLSTPWVILITFLTFPIWFPLLGAAFSIVVAIIAVLLSLIVTLFALVIALGIGGILAIVAAFYYGGAFGISGLLAVGGGLIVLGLAALLFFPIMYLIKGIWKGIKALCHKIASWFKRRKKDEQTG